MNLSGEHRIKALREAVWRTLDDPAILRQAIPGCATAATFCRARVQAKIGPVSAVFTGRAGVNATP